MLTINQQPTTIIRRINTVVDHADRLGRCCPKSVGSIHGADTLSAKLIIKVSGMAIALLAGSLMLQVGTVASQAASVDKVGESGATAIAYYSRIAGDKNRTRLVVDFDRIVNFKTLFLENPNRLIVDLPETIFSFGNDGKEPVYGLISDFRYGAIAPGRSRIVLLTSAPTRIDQATIKPLGDDGHYRLKLDIVKTDQQGYREAIFRQSGNIGASGNVAYKGDRIKRQNTRTKNRITVVIDPGHGGIDGGAKSQKAGTEKNITLNFALALKTELEKVKQLRVIMTRERDVFVSLSERVAIARRNKAKLMISIHADSLKQKGIRGATIYTLSQEGSDTLAQQMAESENRSDLLAGLSVPEQNSEVVDILVELTRRETEVFSKQFARTLVSQLKGRIPLIKNPQRAANFHVLRAPEVPSVLFELGYISNLKDIQQMNSPRWRQQTASNVKTAIMNYLRPRIARGE